jgi:hypothetical protein
MCVRACVCVCVCVCVFCVSVSVSVCVCVCQYLYLCVCLCVCVFDCECVYDLLPTFACNYECVCDCTCAWLCLCVVAFGRMLRVLIYMVWCGTLSYWNAGHWCGCLCALLTSYWQSTVARGDDDGDGAAREPARRKVCAHSHAGACAAPFLSVWV